MATSARNQLQIGAIGIAQFAGNKQSETGSLMAGGEKRFEDLLAVFLGNARAVVDDMQFYAPRVTGRYLQAHTTCLLYTSRCV